jgi:hypothetical protein
MHRHLVVRERVLQQAVNNQQLQMPGTGLDRRASQNQKDIHITILDSM